MNVNRMVDALRYSASRSVVCFESEKQVVRVTRRHKPNKRARTEEFVLTIGAPNFREREMLDRGAQTGRLFFREYPR